ncbi:MAG: adenosylcobinamide-GDP ribazoletransferase, partial [Alphaproteobacteria bacterium]
LGPTVAAILAVAALMVVTGALHEDGLADVADGFAGGHDRAQKLAIMHDPSIGTFAVLALVIAVALRVAAIGAIGTVGDQGGGTWPAMAAVIAAAAYSRGVLPVIMHGLGPARSDGLAVEAGRPSQEQALLAVAIGAAVALLTLGLWAGLAAIVAGAAAALLLAALARAQIGGITGDVLGAIQQACEIAVLLAAAALA